MATVKYIFLAIACLCCWTQVDSHPGYRARIPNGNQVPDPCNLATNGLWQGVGHQRSSGGGPRNPFGKDFETAHERWTVELCQADSDGDGKSNGQELGDADCLWTEGATPNVTTGLSHPGICEPINSPLCCGNQTWLTCATPACGGPTTMASTVPSTGTTGSASSMFTYHGVSILVFIMVFMYIFQ